MSVQAPPPTTPLPPAPPDDVFDLSEYQTEDDTPVDSFFHANQQVLLVEQLASSWPGPVGGRPYLITKNVGLFHTPHHPPVVPDVMLALGVQLGTDQSRPENRSYFQWVVGKPPDVAIEVVSHSPGGEDAEKLRLYARIGVPYYAIYDPAHYLIAEELRVYARDGQTYRLVPSGNLRDVGLGLTVWEGQYVGEHARWLRWTDADGILIPTGLERAEAEKHRAGTESLRAEAETRRAEAETRRAEAEARRAETEARRAETETRRAESAENRARQLEEKLARYLAKLKDAGLSPNGD